MKNKILLQGCGWFLATLSVHKVKIRGLSEQGVSYPCHTDAQEQRISCSRAGDLINISILIYNPQHCWCSPGCFEALILWCPLWTASSGHPSSAQSPCGWSRVPFSRKLPRNDTTLKGADTQVHYSIIQENINTKSFLPGGLCRYQVKRKVCKKGSGDVPRSALSLQQKGWGIQGHT